MPARVPQPSAAITIGSADIMNSGSASVVPAITEANSTADARPEPSAIISA